MCSPRSEFNITIQPFQPRHQAAVKELVLAGLAEHWGSLDLGKNPDLNDISASYKNGLFLVAEREGRIIATGALWPRGQGTAEIVRMSVSSTARRQGLGRRMLQTLREHAQARGFKRLVLETTAAWTEVIAFYLANGFHITHYQDGDVYFAQDLVPPSQFGDLN